MDEVIFPLENQCQNVLIVGHGAWNRSILNPLKQMALVDFWSQPLENCAVEVLDLSGSRLSMSEM